MSGDDLCESLGRLEAYLCRYSSQTWTEAGQLPLPELFRRFDRLRDLIAQENESVPDASGRP